MKGYQEQTLITGSQQPNDYGGGVKISCKTMPLGRERRERRHHPSVQEGADPSLHQADQMGMGPQRQRLQRGKLRKQMQPLSVPTVVVQGFRLAPKPTPRSRPSRLGW
jgi:hypothetical protein